MTIEDQAWGAAEMAALDSSSSGTATVPTVVLSSRLTSGHRLESGAPMKRAAFIAAWSLVLGTLGFVTVVLSHQLVTEEPLSSPYVIMGLVSGGLVALMTIRSRPDRRRSADGYLEEWVEAGREMLVVGIALLIVGFFWRPWSIHKFSFSRGTVLLALALGFLSIGIARCGMRTSLLWLRRRGHNLASVVVIGDGPSAAAFIRTISAKTGTGYRIAAHITEAQASHDLSGIFEKLAADIALREVVVASSVISVDQVREVVSLPWMRGARVRTVPELFGLPPSKVQVVQFADFPMLTLFENPVRGAHWMVKRAVDVVVGAVALVLLSPLLAAIAAAVKFTSPGSILFRQERIGMDGKRFDLLKFRTMTAGAPDALHREFMTAMLSRGSPTEPVSAGFYKLTDDPRVTPLGKFLRRFSLDELPQLLNVLRGEMSLVGPRPALAYEVDLYEDWQRRRLDVLPGITGLWQVSGRSRLSPADMLRLDVHYAETWSLPKDFLIILRTIPAIMRDNAR